MARSALAITILTGISALFILSSHSTTALVHPEGSAIVPTYSRSSGPSTWEIVPIGGLPNRKGVDKLDSALSELHEILSSSGISTLSRAAQSMGLQLEKDAVRVVVVSQGDMLESLVPLLEAAGGRVEAEYNNLIQTVIPVSALEQVSKYPGVNYVRRPFNPVPTSVVSEGLASIGTVPWHQAGFRGEGVKVGVIDVGFDGYDARLGVDLPHNVTTSSWRSDLDITGVGNNHGTAVAEIVYDMAPGADFYLVNFGTEVEFGHAVSWLLQQEVDVIVSAVGWPGTGAGDGTGAIADIVRSAKDKGILWVQAAGNFGNTHWFGRFQDTNGNGFHNFVPGDEGNTITLLRSSRGELIYRVEIILTWDDWGSFTNDYDLFLLRGDSVVAQSTGFQNGNFPPVERIVHVTPSPGNYWIAIQRFSATKTATMEIITTVDYDLEYKEAGTSLVIPADSVHALAVGAVTLAGDKLQPYSSQGPTKDGRVKPDVVAPDSVSTATLGKGQFLGTSASAPHVAGAAVLMKQAFPTMTPAEIQSALELQARSLDGTAKNNLFGSGNLLMNQPPARVILPIILNRAPPRP